MKRKLTIGLLALGTVFGLAAGVASVHYRCGHGGWRGGGHHAAFERHVADVCVKAAERARNEAAEK